MGFSALEVVAALDDVAAFRQDPAAGLNCPRCGALGVTLTDHSVRPHAEWFHFACSACKLDETLHIPLGAPVAGTWD